MAPIAMDDSDSETTTSPPAFDWGDTTQANEVRLKLKVPRSEYYFFKGWTIKDVKETWPCGDTGYTKQDQINLLSDLQRFYKQPHVEDGEHVVVTEIYRSPRSGFPGRLHSSSGCQGLVRALRSNLLKETADIDMNCGMPRCILWACKHFDILVPQLEFYIENRNGSDGMSQRIMDEAGVSKGKAKQLFIMTLTNGKKLRTSSTYLKKVDAENKETQVALMSRPELKWILPYCKADNRAGSFMSYLYYYIECKLLVRVHRMFTEEINLPVATLLFDGMNVADQSKHGDQVILDRASAVCEEVAPGINMLWAWKELDFALESNEKKPLTNSDGEVKELRVPESYRPPRQKEAQRNCADDELDPDTEPTYEELRKDFSLNLGGTRGKVNCEYIEVGEGGEVTLFDKSHFKEKFRHMVFFELVEGQVEEEGEDGAETRLKKKKSAFIEKWMSDERMDPRYLKSPSEKYCWEKFDMFPVSADCPDNVYNLWKGFAAESMDCAYDSDVRAGLCSAVSST